MIHTPEFWVAVSFVIFMALVWKKASAAIGSLLDGRAEKIRSELDEAERLHKDAQALLNGYQRRQADALKEAEAVLAHAREEAARLRTQAGADLEASLKRREAQAMDRIALAEQNAIQSVKARAVEIAIRAATGLVTEAIDKDGANALVDQAIADLPKRARA